MNASVSSRVWNLFKQMSGKLPGSGAIKAGVLTAAALLAVSSAQGQRVTSTIGAGTAPTAVEVNPVTNKVYVANSGSNNVTVIDGATNSTATVAAGTGPAALAVNPVTNKVYVANQGGTVTVINGNDNSTIPPVNAGTAPAAIAVNPVSNKIYVANSGSSNVTVINGSTDAVLGTVTVGTTPTALGVNPDKPDLRGQQRQQQRDRD